ncbi:MAG: hypothetical protein IPG11_12960 [Flavobacteriales bacterium]|nr:hypothetical protein [Flavobacteriales bacterium]
MRILCFILLLCTAPTLWGQGRFTSLMNSLEAAIVDQPGLDGTVELSVSGAGDGIRARPWGDASSSTSPSTLP